MKELLKKISIRAIELGEVEFNNTQIEKEWIGFDPATEKEIKNAEKSLKIELPSDYKEFVRITNGFASPINTFSLFLPISQIAYFKDIEKKLLKQYKIDYTKTFRISEPNIEALEKSIIIGRFEDEDFILISPPNEKEKNWTYWEDSVLSQSWEGSQLKNLREYFENTLQFLVEDCEVE